MDFYQDLVTGKITTLSLTDAQLKKLGKCWLDDELNVCPNFKVFVDAQDERRRREVERVTKKIKPIDHNFFG